MKEGKKEIMKEKERHKERAQPKKCKSSSSYRRLSRFRNFRPPALPALLVYIMFVGFKCQMSNICVPFASGHRKNRHWFPFPGFNKHRKCDLGITHFKQIKQWLWGFPDIGHFRVDPFFALSFEVAARTHRHISVVVVAKPCWLASAKGLRALALRRLGHEV